jgi:hypothetical protein
MYYKGFFWQSTISLLTKPDRRGKQTLKIYLELGLLETLAGLQHLWNADIN